MIVDDLLALGVLEPLDVHLAHTLGRLGGEQRDEVLLAAALASRAVQRGHVCVDLPALDGRPLVDDEGAPVAVALPAASEWLDLLRSSALVGDGTAPAPLVLDRAGRLYLHRYHAYQERLARQIRERSTAEVAV